MIAAPCSLCLGASLFRSRLMRFLTKEDPCENF